MRCPVCGTKLSIAKEEIQLTPRQVDIMAAIEQVSRDTQRGYARTSEIAAAVGWSVRTVQYELSHLLHIERIGRAGERAGYFIPQERIALVQVA
jgi:hypothetical protein